MSGGVLLPAVSIGLLATDNQEETPHMDNHNVVAIQTPSTDTLTQVLREGAQRLLAQAIQAEVEEFLECHADRRTEDGRAGVTRSGHQPARELQTGIGPVRVRIPKVRSRVGDPVTFRSSLVPPYVRKTRSLEAALPWLYLKGISTGDMSDALEALVGPEARGLSATTVSRLKRRWSEEYTTWRQTSLADRTWVYVWADGVYNRLRGESGKLCVLVVIGVDDRGRKHLLAVDPGLRESSQSWREVLTNLTSRGMDAPRLAIGDGAMGFWNAVSETVARNPSPALLDAQNGQRVESAAEKFPIQREEGAARHLAGGDPKPGGSGVRHLRLGLRGQVPRCRRMSGQGSRTVDDVLRFPGGTLEEHPHHQPHRIDLRHPAASDPPCQGMSVP